MDNMHTKAYCHKTKYEKGTISIAELTIYHDIIIYCMTDYNWETKFTNIAILCRSNKSLSLYIIPCDGKSPDVNFFV